MLCQGQAHRRVTLLTVLPDTTMKNTFGFIFLFILCTDCKRQNNTDLSTVDNTPEVKGEGIPNGPGGPVRTIKQDRKGNIWITSWDGVFRYDGKSFTNITSKVSSARFFSLLEDRKGNFWFGSIGSGVYYYDGKSFQNFTTRDGLLNNDVTSIYEDKAGNIWFGVFGGASRYDGISFRNYIIHEDAMYEDKTGKTFQDRPPYEVNAILEDKRGKLWFATRGNTFVYDGKTFTIIKNKQDPFINVRAMIEDRKGNVWLGGTRYDGNTFTSFTQRFVLFTYEDSMGNIWMGSSGTADKDWVLSRYDATSLENGKLTVTEIKPEVGFIFTMLEAHDGNIWLGADGVYRYDGKTFHGFKSKEPGK